MNPQKRLRIQLPSQKAHRAVFFFGFFFGDASVWRLPGGFPASESVLSAVETV